MSAEGNHNGMPRDQLVTISDLAKLKNDLLEGIKFLLQRQGENHTKKWLRSSEVRKMLGISPGTLQNFRINGKLKYAKIGGIVFYKHDEIIKMLEEKATNRNG